MYTKPGQVNKPNEGLWIQRSIGAVLSRLR